MYFDGDASEGMRLLGEQRERKSIHLILIPISQFIFLSTTIVSLHQGITTPRTRLKENTAHSARKQVKHVRYIFSPTCPCSHTKD